MFSSPSILDKLIKTGLKLVGKFEDNLFDVKLSYFYPN